MIYSVVYYSPIGGIAIDTTQDAVVGVNFVDVEDTSSKEPDFLVLPPILKQAYTEIDEYFCGVRSTFSVRTEQDRATAFRKKVYEALKEIPYGKTVSYLQIAEQIGSPKAVRAIGGANHNNNICILIPCHRVIGANGKLTGYRGGLDRKEWLLAHEAKLQYNFK